MDVETATLWVLAAALFPLWLAAGMADYLCHRATKIETTSGLIESVSHLTLASLMGAGVIAVMFLQMNAFLLALLIPLFAAHEVVTHLDLRWSAPLREIGPLEQQVHAFLEAIPFAALALVGVVVLTMNSWNFGPAVRADVNWGILTPMLAAMMLFGAVPYWEEFFRCLRSAPVVKS